MTRSSVVIGSLAAALALSNVAWAFAFLVRDVDAGSARRAARQAMTLLPMVARPELGKEGIVAAAIRTKSPEEPIEREGYVWVGYLGLRFDNGVLVEVRSPWDF